MEVALGGGGGGGVAAGGARRQRRCQAQRAPLRRRRACAARAVPWTQRDADGGADALLWKMEQQQQQSPPWAARGAGAAAPSAPPRDLRGDPMGVLARQRVVFLGGEVEDFGADALVSQLLMLDQQDPGKDIKVFINSPGGGGVDGVWCACVRACVAWAWACV
jgi:hypothetical protein